MKLDTITKGMRDLKFCEERKPTEDPKLSFHIENSDEGDNAVGEIAADERFTGRVYIKIGNSDRIHSLYVKDGYKRFEIRNLVRGNHIATLSFYGNHLFLPDEASAKFIVYKERIDPNLSLKINDAEEDDMAIVEIGADELFNDFVYLKIGNSDKIHSIHVKDGSKRFKIRNLVRGKYAAILSYRGNSLFKPKYIRMTYLKRLFSVNR